MIALFGETHYWIFVIKSKAQGLVWGVGDGGKGCDG